MNKNIQKIFSIKNTDNHKIFTILGTKVKLKRVKPLNISQKQIINEIYSANIVKDIHSKTFPKFKGCSKGKDIVLIASGPTLTFYEPPCNTNKTDFIGVNKVCKNEKIKLDYIFAQDYFSVKDYIDDIINYPAEIFLGSFLLNSTFSWINKCIIPQKYLNLRNINRYISDYGKNLGYPYIENCGLMDFGSTVFPAIHFAFYTNPDRIFIVGCDCSDVGYFDGSSRNPNVSLVPLINGWKKIKEYRDTYYPDTEIISINPVGLKGMFKDVYTKSYYEKNQELFEDNNITFYEDLFNQ